MSGPGPQTKRGWWGRPPVHSVLLAACALGTASCADRLPYDGSPDVVLVVVDALRRDHVGLYGYPEPTTPALDALEDRCTVFENAYSQASNTFNSTSTLLTSRYFPLLTRNQWYEGVPGAPEPTQQAHAAAPYLMQENVTLAERMQAAGYETVGLFTNPHHHPTSGFWQGFEHPRFLEFEERPITYAKASRLYDAFFDWFDRRDPARPYFAYVHFMDPHHPHTPPRRLRREFVTVKGRDGLFFSGTPTGDLVPSADDLTYMTALYDASIRHVDEVLGRMLAELARRGGLDDTVLVFASDHGDEYMDHGGLGHGQTLEKELVHVPLAICPDLAPGEYEGRRFAGLVRNLDVAPTVLDLAGAPRPRELEGRSLVPALLGRRFRGVESSLAWVGSLRSLTTARWHLTWDLRSGEKKLYDNREDPRGTIDLAERRAEVVERLSAEIERLEERRRAARELAGELVSASPDAAGEEASEEVLEQLRALGYLAEEDEEEAPGSRRER